METATWDTRGARLDPQFEPTANRVELTGYVGAPPEVRYKPEGEPLIRIQLATHRWRQTGEGALQQLTDWHTILVSDDAADRAKRLRVGELIRVDGWLHTATTDGSGRYQAHSEVVATRVQRVTQRARQACLPLSV